MRNTFFIAILSIFLSFTLNAQQKSDHFYYYKGEKIFLQSTDKLFIRLEPNINNEQLLHTLINCDTSMFIYKACLKNKVYHFAIFEAKDRKAISSVTIECYKTKEEVISATHLLQYYHTLQGLTDEFIVKLKPTISFIQLQELAEKNNCKVGEENKYVKNQFTIHALKTSSINALQLSNLFYETGLFDYAEPNFIVLDPYHSNDSLFHQQWGLKNTGQYGGMSGIDIKAEQAWSITEGDSNIRIAVVDDGVDLTHPDLRDNLLPGYDVTGGNSGGAPEDPNDTHGTSCSGIIGAVKDNEIGIAGVAPNCKIIPILIFQGGWLLPTFAADGINAAWQNGADVISCSWGSRSPFTSITNAIDSAVTYGRNGLGCVIVFSSGNYYASPHYPTVNFPAWLPNVIAVGAITPNGKRKEANYHYDWGSCYGPELDVMAPGEMICTTIYQEYPWSSENYDCDFDGTSAACPHVSGVAALILSVNPNLTGQEVRNIIESTAQKVREDLYTYSDTIIGRPNGTWHNEMGYGLVNAYEAVRKAICNDDLPIMNGVISQNTTWNTPVQVLNVIVPNGVTLTITSEVKCSATASITVAPGGKLIVNGGTLSNSCDSVMWQGIIVQGNPKTPYPPHGIVELYNGATIENAICGINAVNGGIVDAMNANFINNSVGLQANMYSEANIANTQFLIDSGFFEGNYSFTSHVRLYDNSNSVFVACQFSIDPISSVLSRAAYGIWAFNSNVLVLEECTFSKLTAGVYASHSGTVPSVWVEKSIFSDNGFGVRLSGIDHSNVVSNNFILSRTNTYGLYNLQSTGYQFKENTFSNTDNSLITTGVYISKSGAAENEIRENSFYDLNVGIQAIDKNSSQELIFPPLPPITGLQFLCNYFFETQQTDFVVGNLPGQSYSGDHSVRKNQGDPQRPAGNIFVKQCRYNVSNYSNYPIFYYYNDYEPNEHLCAYVGAVYRERLPLNSDCPPMNKSILSLSQYDEWNNLYEYWLALATEVTNEEEYLMILDQVSYYSALKDNYFNRIIVSEMNEKEKGEKEKGEGEISLFERLRFLFAYRGHYIDYLSITETHLAESNYAEALATLARIYNQFEIAEEQLLELQGLGTYINWLQQLEKEEMSIYTLSPQKIDELVKYIETNTGRGAVFVSNILCDLYDICIEKEENPEYYTAPKPTKGGESVAKNTMQIDDKTLLDKITVIPNPTTGELEIKNYELEIKSIEVFDVYGRKVSSHHLIATSSHHHINISHLPPGIYFIKITTTTGTQTQKIIKL